MTGFGTMESMHVPIFNRLMLLLPLALLTRAWKFFDRNEHLIGVTVTVEHHTPS